MSDLARDIHLNAQLWIHQSNLLWSRLQTISAIQVGAFTGWYFLRDNDVGLASLVMALAFVLTLLMAGIVWRDVTYLDAFGSEIRSQVPKSWISGRGCAYAILLVLLICDIVLGICPLLCRDKPQPQGTKEETVQREPHNASTPKLMEQKQANPQPNDL